MAERERFTRELTLGAVGWRITASMRYRIAAATTTDRVWLEQLRRSVYKELFVATFGGWDEARHLRHCEECWERGHIFLIESEGVRMGMIQMIRGAEAVEVCEIQIAPPHQNHGLGTQLLTDLIAGAHAVGQTVRLSVGLKNDRALALYRRLGFRVVGHTDTHVQLRCAPPSSSPEGRHRLTL